MNASRMEHPEDLIAECTDILTATTASATLGAVNPLKEAIGLMPCTVDILFILLGQVDYSTGTYRVVQNVDTERCALMETLGFFIGNIDFANAIESRLCSVTRTTRRALVAALVNRAPQFVSISEGDRIIGIAKSIRLLSQSVSYLAESNELWKEFQKQEFLRKYTAACASLAEMALARNITDAGFWKALSSTTLILLLGAVLWTSDPAAALAEAFEAGLFLCMVRCLPYGAEHRPPDPRYFLPPGDVLPYMMVRKVFDVIWKRGDLEHFLRRRDLPEAVEAACQEYGTVLGIAHEVHISRRDTPISICSNLNHSTSPLGTDHPSGPRDFKACSKCHVVMYCSKSCQEEDWAALHKRECKEVRARQYLHPRMKATLHSVALKMEYIAHLEYAVNANTMGTGPKIAIPARKTRPGQPFEKALPILVFDFARYPPGPPQLPGGGVGVSLDTTSLDQEWGERIERCIAATEEDIFYRGAQGVGFVESTFPLDHLNRLFVFAKIRLDEEAPEGWKWKVVASVFRVGKQPALMGPDESRFTDVMNGQRNI
ncbi:hypothetical protein DFP72DRAFT_867934 [Ephemerocybe angulata]|uniref:MYND-type domain-containing protein n=1 Tax=Ephemerocybe angulata TaxID=980116 RepID=A0A8H6MED1_9AGAR|nr:hypothetical protein DFP72DRAFT_867934 [Tulosesus angulatus]